MRSALVRLPIDIPALISELSDNCNGAASVFIGTVRSLNEGREVLGMEYSAYEPMAEKEISDIMTEASARFGVQHIVIEHRLGALVVGDASVVIVTAHPHRADAIDAMRYCVEELKARVPIWKREQYADGSRDWVSAATGRSA